ncbi:MAG TPA: hypothetical protein VGH28_09600 [Polyangiaceae bacterium]|jgi:hypothetical protein
MTTEADDILEWHRVEGAVLGSLALGASILFCGPILAAIAFVGFKDDLVPEVVIAILAGLCVVVGPAYAILKLAHSLGEDAWISARKDGIVFERNGKALRMAWDDIERVEHEPPQTLVFRRREGEAFVLKERFATIEVAELQKRLEDLRRKASFGLLPK